jgi:hypothetical protein
MNKKRIRHSAEQIVKKLRDADAMLSGLQLEELGNDRPRRKLR